MPRKLTPGSVTAENLIRLLSSDGQVRLVVVDVTEPLRTSRLREVTAHAAQELYKQIYTNCALLRGLLGEEERVSVNLRFRGEGRFCHAAVDGLGNIHCSFSEALRTFDGDPRELVGEGATLSITRGSWTGGMFTGTVELPQDSLDQCFTHFYRQSEQLETVFHSWTTAEPIRGCLVQPLPSAVHASVRALVKRVQEASARLQTTAWDDIESVFASFARVVGRGAVRSECYCSKEMLRGLLAACDLEELERAIAQEDGLEVECGLCGRKYRYDGGDLQAVVDLKRKVGAWD
ncbi:MAG: hypothetical protein BAA04_00320 [Firmicutes bacterium ZCTH02-B6]|nr:MAG: hypothetical protein BAA04_00320 [Firmicutes bacterium ZCTH02-B6]